MVNRQIAIPQRKRNQRKNNRGVSMNEYCLQNTHSSIEIQVINVFNVHNFLISLLTFRVNATCTAVTSLLLSQHHQDVAG